MSKSKFTAVDIKDAFFCVAIMGQTNSAQIIQGWNALVETVETAFYGEKPNLQDRVIIVKDLSNWPDWVQDLGGMPFHKMTQRADNKVFVEIFRLTDEKYITKDVASSGGTMGLK